MMPIDDALERAERRHRANAAINRIRMVHYNRVCLAAKVAERAVFASIGGVIAAPGLLSGFIALALGFGLIAVVRLKHELGSRPQL